MKLEITLSILLHVVLVIATTIVMPMNSTKKFDFDDVIRVNLASFPEPAPQQVAPPAPAPIQPKVEEQAIPISKPKVPPKTVAKAKPKPKAQPKTKPVETEEAETEAEPTDVTGAGPGSPFEGAKVDNASFNYPYWFTQAWYKIRSNLRPPLYDGTLVCVIYFQVIRSGSVVEMRIESSSGVDDYDACCLAAIERSKPFPPLPREFVDEIIGITAPFKYDPPK
jgi:periplasmic protein TonB